MQDWSMAGEAIGYKMWVRRRTLRGSLFAILEHCWHGDRVWGSFAHQSCRTISFLSVRFRGWRAAELVRWVLEDHGPERSREFR